MKNLFIDVWETGFLRQILPGQNFFYLHSAVLMHVISCFRNLPSFVYSECTSLAMRPMVADEGGGC